MVRTRAQIHEGKKITLNYRDEHGRDSQRTIWPIAVGYHEAVRMVAAWCELRKDFRSFRTDRVVDAVYHDEKYPERRDSCGRNGGGAWSGRRPRTPERIRDRLSSPSHFPAKRAMHNPTPDIESPCQACGACCSYSSNWPRFTIEDDSALDLIPEKFVNGGCRGCAARATAAPRCQARSARRRRA